MYHLLLNPDPRVSSQEETFLLAASVESIKNEKYYNIYVVVYAYTELIVVIIDLTIIISKFFLFIDLTCVSGCVKKNLATRANHENTVDGNPFSDVQGKTMNLHSADFLALHDLCFK